MMRSFVGAAAAAVVLLAGSSSGQDGVCSEDADTLASYENDGYCDELLGDFNSWACGWDGGDCCESTCQSTLYTCGVVGYNCKDPNATDYDSANCTAANEAVGDGYCDVYSYNNDLHLNKASCDWDGGDCCQSTCVGACDHLVYYCLDPNATDYNERSECEAPNPAWLADGFCDHNTVESDIYNTEKCNWDGGDCCEDTCVDGEYSCSDSEWVCFNPESSNYTFATCDVEYPSYIADAYCDANADNYNTMACNWDGGDCCEDTCEAETLAYECGVIGYACLDPSSSNYLICPGANSSLLGDGYCDQYAYNLELHLNTEACSWDNGDCCPSTCIGDCTNVVYDCLNPNASDYGDVSACDVASPSWIGDAYCDTSSPAYNTLACAWDGGDCCEISCLAEDTTYECGSNGYSCVDPEFSDGSCQAATLSWLRDGFCDDAS